MSFCSPQAIGLLVLALLLPSGQRPTHAQDRYIFWIGSRDSTEVRGSTIFRYTLHTGDVDTLVRAAELDSAYADRVPEWFSHVTVDTIRNHIYWTDVGGNSGPEGTVLIGAIRHASWNGDDPVVVLGSIVCGLGGPADIELDAVNETVYWGERSDCIWTALYRWYFWDPFWVTLPISGGYVVEHIELDLHNQMMYWVSIDEPVYQNEPPPGIVRAPISDTADDEHIVTGCVGDIALAHMLSKIYWSPCNSNQIRRANLDGSSNEAVFDADGEVSHLAIDHKEGKIYWTEFESGKLSRANLDGTDAEDLLTNLIGPSSLALSFGWNSRLSTAPRGATGAHRIDLRGIYPN